MYGSTALGTPCPSGRSPGLMAAPVPTNRSGRRIPQILAAELSDPGNSVPKEMTVTENLSLHGARVTTVRRCLPQTRVLVPFLRDSLRAQARLGSCQRNGQG